MAINFKLSDVKPVDREDDPMDREWVGYRPTLTGEEVFDQNRGMWYLRLDKVEKEDYATFSYKGKIVAVAELSGVETLPWADPRGRRDKQAVTGKALGPGHPAYEFFNHRLVPGASRNPVSYIDDPEPRPEPEPGNCACGCGTAVPEGKHFVPGHDQRAVHERIARRWGDTLGFISWFDETYPGEGGLTRVRADT